MTLRRRIIEVTYDDTKGEPAAPSGVVSVQQLNDYEVENAVFDEATGTWQIVPWEDLLVAQIKRAITDDDFDGEVTRVEFGTWEWDNGYFYYYSAQITIAGEKTTETYSFEDCDPILTELAAENGPLGANDTLTVDLTTGLVNAS